jgi:myo-inositol-1(or 4)-monophosphatase
VPAEALFDTLINAVAAIERALAKEADWSRPGGRAGQYWIDVVADEAGGPVLLDAGLDVLSEESGLTSKGGDLLAVIDPVDGSTNASRRIPWYATSICVLDEDGPLCALVINLASGTRYQAVRGEGATRDGGTISPSAVGSLADAVVGTSGMGHSPLGWRQFRTFGAAALDLCCVADGRLDAFCDFSAALGPWDYLGGMLICEEAGGRVGEARGRDLVARGLAERRSVVAAGTEQLFEELMAARSGAGVLS